MTGHPFAFAGADFVAMPSGVLWWPARKALIAADLHLGKSGRIARSGSLLLPPYETRDTLARLGAEANALRAARLILLGDVFDDEQARAALGESEHALWSLLCAGRDCDILAGNHDPGALNELVLDGIALRHIAGQGPDISGHFHPKLRILGHRIAAFLVGADHVILPAFGTYTGGLDISADALRTLVPQGFAVLTGRVARVVPVTGGSVRVKQG